MVDVRKSLLLLTILAFLTGCPDDSESTVDAGGAGGAGGGGGGACDALDCGGHGTCTLAGGLPACLCDPGFEEQGLECVELSTEGPPADFTCPAPGETSALLTSITDGRWAFVQSDRTCAVSGVKDIYALQANGVFTINSQFGTVAAGRGGTLLYGCWSVVDAQADRLIVTYDFAVETSRNCGPIAGYADPPACTGAIAFSAADDALLLIDNEERNQERILLFRVPSEPACAWCGDAATCCDQASWVADGSGPLCD